MGERGSLHLKSRVPWVKHIGFHFGLAELEVSIRCPREMSKDYRVMVETYGLWLLWVVQQPLTGVTYDHWKTQIFALQFIMIAKLHLRSSNKNNLLVVDHHNMRSWIKMCSIREVDNHCCNDIPILVTMRTTLKWFGWSLLILSVNF